MIKRVDKKQIFIIIYVRITMFLMQSLLKKKMTVRGFIMKIDKCRLTEI